MEQALDAKSTLTNKNLYLYLKLQEDVRAACE